MNALQIIFRNPTNIRDLEETILEEELIKTGSKRRAFKESLLLID